MNSTTQISTAMRNGEPQTLLPILHLGLARSSNSTAALRSVQGGQVAGLGGGQDDGLVGRVRRVLVEEQARQPVCGVQQSA